MQNRSEELRTQASARVRRSVVLGSNRDANTRGNGDIRGELEANNEPGRLRTRKKRLEKSGTFRKIRIRYRFFIRLILVLPEKLLVLQRPLTKDWAFNIGKCGSEILLFNKRHTALHMHRMREHIHRSYLHCLVSAIFEHPQVSGQCRWITRHIHHTLRLHSQNRL